MVFKKVLYSNLKKKIKFFHLITLTRFCAFKNIKCNFKKTFVFVFEKRKGVGNVNKIYKHLVLFLTCRLRYQIVPLWNQGP